MKVSKFDTCISEFTRSYLIDPAGWTVLMVKILIGTNRFPLLGPVFYFTDLPFGEGIQLFVFNSYITIISLQSKKNCLYIRWDLNVEFLGRATIFHILLRTIFGPVYSLFYLDQGTKILNIDCLEFRDSVRSSFPSKTEKI